MVLSSLSCPVVLVVDDSPVVQKLMTNGLEKAGFFVETAVNGREVQLLCFQHSVTCSMAIVCLLF